MTQLYGHGADPVQPVARLQLLIFSEGTSRSGKRMRMDLCRESLPGTRLVQRADENGNISLGSRPNGIFTNRTRPDAGSGGVGQRPRRAPFWSQQWARAVGDHGFWYTRNKIKAALGKWRLCWASDSIAVGAWIPYRNACGWTTSSTLSNERHGT